jgi:hypothetical protein
VAGPGDGILVGNRSPLPALILIQHHPSCVYASHPPTYDENLSLIHNEECHKKKGIWRYRCRGSYATSLRSPQYSSLYSSRTASASLKKADITSLVVEKYISPDTQSCWWLLLSIISRGCPVEFVKWRLTTAGITDCHVMALLILMTTSGTRFVPIDQAHNAIKLKIYTGSGEVRGVRD